METTFKPKNIESRIYKLWEKGGYFTPSVEPSKKSFVIIMPPPNTTGALHIGHAVFVTIEDILIRYHRMKGDATLWVPGVDHAGIITQVVYEKELAKQGKTRFDLGQEEFYQQTYKFSIEKKKIIEKQLKKMGASCDWSRMKFTLDPKISEAVYYTFKKMFEDGLIYRGERIINWCPRCQTALSDLEVKHKNQMAKLYYINYPIVDSKASIQVATTRPETMLGDSAVAVNPKDKRYQKFLKEKVRLILPLKERVIPLIADERVSMEFGTGAVKITPAHDPIDFETGKEHKLPIIKVIGADGKMVSEAGKEYEGLDVSSCREKVLKKLKSSGFLSEEKNYQQAVETCERCGATLEPLVSKQWFVKTKELAKKAIEVVKKKKIKIIPKHYEKIYFHWLENIKDWCISRQIWWGQRIPVWYCRCGETIVDIKYPKNCPKCGDTKLKQEPDTLDTWFSSGQWPFNVFGWPKKTRDFKYFYPTTVMETGYDILFFWVARMIMLGLYCTGKVPFKYVYLHGLVRDKDRQKMSKSKGNVIDPLGVIELYGADALRMALVFGTGIGRDIIISEEKIISQRNFTTKIWNAARFTFQNLGENGEFLRIKESELKFTKEDKWIFSELKKTAKKMTRYLENFQFHLAAKEIYQFFWHKFCDKTIEDVKKRLQESQNLKDRLTAKRVLYEVFLTSLKLLHPFMPFITEELYQKLPGKQKKALMIEDWPK